MYIYPEHLKAKATLFLWELKDVVGIGIFLVCSVFAFAQTGSLLPLVLTAGYGFLSIQFEGYSILKFLRYAICFFIIKQQIYEWKEPR